MTPAAGDARAPPLWLLGMIAISGSMAMYMVVPALPDVALDLGVSRGQAQLAISVYVLGLAAGHLVYGPLSDALGRRPVLIAGLALYLAGGWAAALANDLQLLLLGRLLQALGGSAGVSLARTIVRETSPNRAVVRRLALLNMMILVSPGLGPALGGFLSSFSGWRAVLMVPALAGAVTLALTCRRLPETLLTRRPLRIGGLARQYASLLCSARFVAYAVGGGLTTTAFYAFVVASPFIFTRQLGVPAHLAGIYTCVMMLGLAVGNGAAGWLSRFVDDAQLLRAGTGLSLCAVAALLLALLAGRLSVPVVIACMLAFNGGCGLVALVALSRALAVNDRLIGTAAGLCGFFQMSIAAACATLSAIGSDPALSAGIVMLVATLLGQLAFAIGLRLDRRQSS